MKINLSSIAEAEIGFSPKPKRRAKVSYADIGGRTPTPTGQPGNHRGRKPKKHRVKPKKISRRARR